MKRIITILLSIVLSIGCMGLMGCADGAGGGGGDGSGILPPTEAQIIKKLENKINNETLGSLLEPKGGYKISMKMTNEGMTIPVSISAKKADGKVFAKMTSTIGALSIDMYTIDGFTVGETVPSSGVWEVQDYESLDSRALSMISMLVLSGSFDGSSVGGGPGGIGDMTGSLVKYAPEYKSVGGNFEYKEFYENSGVPMEIKYSFDSNYTLTGAVVKVYNLLEMSLAIEYEAQTFTVPDAALAVKLDTDKCKALKIQGDAIAEVQMLDFLEKNGGVKADATGTTINTNPDSTTTDTGSIYFIKGSFLSIDGEDGMYIRGNDAYSLYEDTGAKTVDYEVSSSSDLMFLSFMMQMLIGTVDNDDVVVMTQEADGTKLASGNNYIIIKDNKLVKSHEEYMGETSAYTTDITFTYGAQELPIPVEITNYMKTDKYLARKKAIDRLDSMRITNLRKQKGLKIVSSVDGQNLTILADFSKFYDQAKFTYTESEAGTPAEEYQYKETIAYVEGGVAKEDNNASCYYELLFDYCIDKINFDKNTITVTDSLITITSEDALIVTKIFIADGKLITKVENSSKANPEATATVETITVTYGEQTVTIPELISAFVDTTL